MVLVKGVGNSRGKKESRFNLGSAVNRKQLEFRLQTQEQYELVSALTYSNTAIQHFITRNQRKTDGSGWQQMRLSDLPQF